MSAATLLPFEDWCGTCLALLHSGRCPACDLVPIQVSPATSDLATLLAGPDPLWAGAAYVVTTAAGEITLRAGQDALRLDVERFGGAVAAAFLDETVTLDLATDLLLVLRHGVEGLWADGVQAFPVSGGSITLRPFPVGIRLSVDRAGGAVAWVDLDLDAVGDLAAQLMLSLRRRHWGAQHGLFGLSGVGIQPDGEPGSLGMYGPDLSVKLFERSQPTFLNFERRLLGQPMCEGDTGRFQIAVSTQVLQSFVEVSEVLPGGLAGAAGRHAHLV